LIEKIKKIKKNHNIYFLFLLYKIFKFYSQSQQYPFLNNFNTERFSNTLYGQSTQPLTEQSQVLTEDTFPPSTVEKMNELYLYDKESSIDQQLSFAFNP